MNYNFRKYMIKPNFFILGAAHSGTTSFYHYLLSNPSVFMSLVKEPNYFSTQINKLHKNLKSETKEFTKTEYLELFVNVKNEKIIGEASTRYLYDLCCPNLINQFNSEANFLIILRDPVKRYMSHFSSYYGSQSQKEIKKIILSEIKEKKEKIIKPNILNIGCYYEQITNFYKFFSKEKIKILFFEEIFPNNVKKYIKETLDIFKIPIHEFEIVKYNQFYQKPQGITKIIFKNKIMKNILQISNMERFATEQYKKRERKKEQTPQFNKENIKLLQEFYKGPNMDLKKIIDLPSSWE